MSAPERIWFDVEGGTFIYPNQLDETDVEYIRADIHAREAEQLRAELAEIKADLSYWKGIADEHKRQLDQNFYVSSRLEAEKAELANSIRLFLKSIKPNDASVELILGTLQTILTKDTEPPKQAERPNHGIVW
jgi:hypothetical protein